MNISIKWAFPQLGFEKLEHYINHQTQEFTVELVSFENRTWTGYWDFTSTVLNTDVSMPLSQPIPHLPSVVICCTTLPSNTHWKWCHDFPLSISLTSSDFTRAPDPKYTETQIFPVLFTETFPVLTQNQLNEH